LYPWGNEERAVEFPRTGTYAVGSIVENRSPFGIFDMVGNVWEWVGEPYAPVEPGNRILRGGAHGFLQDTAYRLQGDPSVPTMSATAGIRCAAGEVRIVDSYTVLFEDNFTDPNSGWPVLAEERGLFGYHPPAYYHVEVSVPKEHGIVSRGPSFDNVVVESDVFVAKTDTDNRDFRYGLAMRRSGEQFYAFTISPRSKAWHVLKSSPDGLEVLDQGTFNAIQGLSEDAADILNVYTSGNNFVFHINGQIVTEVSDRDYANGEIGFYVENFDESLSHIHYKSLTVREIEAGEVAIIRGEQALSQDDFTDPDSGWPVLVEESGLYGYHPPAFYHVEVSTPSEKGTVSRGPNFDNVTIESDMFVAKTDTDTGDFRYGLVIRRSGEQFYAFTISPRSKTWHVLKSSSYGLDVLDEGSNDTIQGFGEDNTDVLRVDAEGTNLAFHINDQIVTLVGDADYANGEVGFYVENFDESMAHIHYDMLTIREVEFEEAAEFMPEATLDPDPSTSDVVERSPSNR
jgi:hypothetical protein